MLKKFKKMGVTMLVLAIALMNNLFVCNSFIKKGTEVGLLKDYVTVTTTINNNKSVKTYRYMEYDWMKRDSKGNYYFEDNGIIYEYSEDRVSYEKANGNIGVYEEVVK